MIGDIVFDRKGGIPYSPKKFYDDVMRYVSTGSPGGEIADALDGGEEDDVRKEIWKYLVENDWIGYNRASLEMLNWIYSVNWIED